MNHDQRDAGDASQFELIVTEETERRKERGNESDTLSRDALRVPGRGKNRFRKLEFSSYGHHSHAMRGEGGSTTNYSRSKGAHYTGVPYSTILRLHKPLNRR